MNQQAANWDYRGFAFLARHRYGLTNGLTVGYRAEGGTELLSGGPLLNVRLPFGELELAGLRCVVVLEVPVSDQPMVNLGTVSCKVRPD